MFLSTQPFIPGLEPIHRLFFALFLEAEARQRSVEIASRLRRQHGWSAMPLSPERLHVTVAHLGDHPVLPRRLVQAAEASGEAVEAGAFEAQFDRVAGSRSLVLGGSKPGLAPLRQFRQALDKSMAQAGISLRAGKRFMPHVTLLYDECHLPEQAVDPVRWTVRELVLVYSPQGRSQHIALGRWPLL